MYIGDTDDGAGLHHMVCEVSDNAIDEALAGYCKEISVQIHADNSVTVIDDGRGIPVDEHPVEKKPAAEGVMTTLHSGGKFNEGSYKVSGGLHGVGLSVVNALSDSLTVEVARNKNLWRQSYVRGKPAGKLRNKGKVSNRRGTSITFHPDPKIFGTKAHFQPSSLYRMARSKAYLFSGVEIRWKCGQQDGDTPQEATIHFPGGLSDYLNETLKGSTTYAEHPFGGTVDFREKFNAPGKVEWAINWTPSRDGFIQSYCNTIPTPEGGTHEAGFWSAILKGVKAYGELVGNKKAGTITRDDLITGGCALVSCFIREPEFVGQTKDRLATVDAQRMVENACLLYTSPSPRDATLSRMPSSA